MRPCSAAPGSHTRRTFLESLSGPRAIQIALVSDYFRDDHPAVRRLLGLIAEAAGDTPLALCGELAGRLDMLPFLLATGIHSFSVAPPLVPSVKETIREVRVN